MPKLSAVVPEDERARLAVLDAVARRPILWDTFVLKGGLALLYAYGSPRRSYDLDFTSIRAYSQHLSPETESLLLAFSTLVDEALQEASQEYGFAAMRVHWKQVSDELPILYARVGYSDVPVIGCAFDKYVEMQVTLCETVCQRDSVDVHGVKLNVPVLEDILAEKLKALLQQVARDVYRSSDLYDLWYFLEASGRSIDPGSVSRCFRAKTSGQTGMGRITRARFLDPKVLGNAIIGYEEIARHLIDGAELPPAKVAYDTVLRFVDRLGLPEA